MTTGQRIAQKRKEAALSQEALGAQLGVSRQAIYKWESDAALPEIDKLVALSRIFVVPVGWLLGVEEDAAPPTGDAPEPDTGELNAAQLAMVEEIVARYLAAAAPCPAPPAKRRRWPYVLAVVLFLFVLYSLFNRINNLQNQYQNLNNSVNSLNSNVRNEINAITGRVEEILLSQNQLTADYGCSLDSVDHKTNTVSFAVYATPKTYVEGMTALFVAEHGSGPATQVEAMPGEGNRFSATITCPLTDNIAINVVFVSGDKQETQRIDEWGGLYGASFPYVDFHGQNLWGSAGTGEDTFLLQDRLIALHIDEPKEAVTAEIAEMRVGLFCDKKLVAWATPTGKPSNYHTNQDLLYYMLPEGTQLGPEGIWCFAAVVTDTAGRQIVQADYMGVQYNAEENFWDFADAYEYSSAPADWEY